MNQVHGWDEFYRHGRLASMPELFVVRFFRALRNHGDFLTEHRVDSWPVPPSPSVLDFGCGNGRHLTFLALDGWDVTGCDVSSEAVGLAAAALADVHQERRVDVLARELPYRTGSFDIVLSHGVFDHIPQSERVHWTHEVVRALKPRGLFYASFIGHSLHEPDSKPGEVVLREGEEAGLTQTFYTPTSIIDEYGPLFDIRSIAYDNRGLLHPAPSPIEHRFWAFLERK